MGNKFGDFTTALRFREAVTQIAESVVDRMRPTYRYAEVRGINYVGRKVTVRFPGETTDVVVAAGSIMPRSVGQTVRIAGVGGERYISDVLGDASPPPFLVAVRNAQVNMSGGGRLFCEVSNVWWTARIIIIGVGKGMHFTQNGYYDIYPPAANSTVLGAFGKANVTVTASGGIPLTNWDTLWAILPIGGLHSGVTLRITSYDTPDHMIPDNWVMVAQRNADDGRVRWGTGQTTDYWRAMNLYNGWVNYAVGEYHTAACYKDASNFVHVRGLIRSGAVGGNTTAAELPGGYRPGGLLGGRNIHYSAQQGGAQGQIYVRSGGEVIVPQGSIDWIDLSNITSFLAEN